jgi:hypothetical protein
MKKSFIFLKRFTILFFTGSTCGRDRQAKRLLELFAVAPAVVGVAFLRTDSIYRTKYYLRAILLSIIFLLETSIKPQRQELEPISP